MTNSKKPNYWYRKKRAAEKMVALTANIDAFEHMTLTTQLDTIRSVYPELTNQMIHCRDLLEAELAEVTEEHDYWQERINEHYQLMEELGLS